MDGGACGYGWWRVADNFLPVFESTRPGRGIRLSPSLWFIPQLFLNPPGERRETEHYQLLTGSMSVL